MFKIVKHELKRQLKSKGTLILILITLVLTAFLGYYPASYQRIDIFEADGSVQTLKGVQAVKAIHESKKDFEGEATPEKLLEAHQRYKEVYERYNGEITFEIDSKELRPFKALLNILYYAQPDIFNPGKEGFSLYELSSEDVLAFYENRAANQAAYFEDKVKLSGTALENAKSREAQVEKPFYYSSVPGWDTALEYVGMVATMIAFMVAIIAAQVFSNSYRSGEDEILRCTKLGKKQFGRAKVLATLVLTTGLYILIMALLFGINSATLGIEGLKTSIQFLDTLSPAPFTFGEIWLQSAVYGFIGILATVSLVLFISSKSKASIFVMALSIPLIILPLLMQFVFKVSSLGLTLISDILPTSGLNIFYSLIGGSGSLGYYGAVWSPYITAVAAIIEIGIFAMLAVQSYSRHQAV
ncbi:MAG: ABC transporter permease [Syntrophomonadaceae bacterium]|jgi:hypothetical protein|nr:ABC transporter permease [Syntrophomonadaceae bacterium]